MRNQKWDQAKDTSFMLFSSDQQFKRCLCCTYIRTSAHRWRSSHKIEIIHHVFLKFSRVYGPSGPGYIILFEFPFPTLVQTSKSLASGWKHRQLKLDYWLNSAFKENNNNKECYHRAQAVGPAMLRGAWLGAVWGHGVYLCSNLLLAARQQRRYTFILTKMVLLVILEKVNTYVAKLFQNTKISSRNSCSSRQELLVLHLQQWTGALTPCRREEDCSWPEEMSLLASHALLA